MEAETDGKQHYGRRRYGKLFFILGGLVELFSIVLGGLSGIVSALTNNSYYLSTYSNLIYPVIVCGLFMILIGLLTWLLPEGISEDTLWIVRTGPFPGNN